ARARPAVGSPAGEHPVHLDVDRRDAVVVEGPAVQRHEAGAGVAAADDAAERTEGRRRPRRDRGQQGRRDRRQDDFALHRSYLLHRQPPRYPPGVNLGNSRSTRTYKVTLQVLRELSGIVWARPVEVNDRSSAIRCGARPQTPEFILPTVARLRRWPLT